MNRKLIPAAAVATCAAAVLALFAGPVNADDTPGPVPTTAPTRAPSASPPTSPTARPSVMPSETPVPGSPVPGTPTPGIPTTGPTGRPGTGTGGGDPDATPTPRPSGGSPTPTPAPGCARPVPQLPTPEGVPGYGTVGLTMCATDHRTGRGKLVFTAGYDTGGPMTYRVSLRWTYEGKPEAGCESCWSSARYAFTEDVYVNDAVHGAPLTVPFVLQHRGELIGEQRPGTGVTVVDIQPLEPNWQDNPAFVAPVPGATQPPRSP
ncbi:hypothetical protein [Streptomyces sp. NRRL S-237]|uniref:hypothetical protein n=1 Tax=Streptomyces sp. NRRL S-237 TaxID=1463895 RepID=UPI0004C62032|nr:hypothetical protein [Streptomyces sp. NRRL S-237]